jgi:hypothetical protein
MSGDPPFRDGYRDENGVSEANEQLRNHFIELETQEHFQC